MYPDIIDPQHRNHHHHIMKYTLFITFLASIVLFSCSKDKKQDEPTNDDILNKKIEDIIPKKYLDTLRLLGLDVKTGTKPPDVQGTYSITPYILDTSNISSDSPGARFLDATVTLSDQSGSDYSIKLIGKNFVSVTDTSIATAISGSGNDFTIYGKIKSTRGTGYAIFGIVFTATKEGDHLKNYRIGIINIDNSHGTNAGFIPEGKGRVGYDSDFISEKIAAKAAPENINTTGGRISPGIYIIK